jgi:broad specificity phosphatase PhoE
MSSPTATPPALVHIIRHGEALHNVQRGYPYPDPPLTEAGMQATEELASSISPDIIVISPMTRTIQTAMNVFPFLQVADSSVIPVEIWPDLREANDAICNKGLSRTDIQTKFPQFDFSECHETWDYANHTTTDAVVRAERVRRRLYGLSTRYKSIVVISHRGLLAFLVQGRRFNPAELRSYRFATGEETQDKKTRQGLHCESLQELDFGPTVLLACDELNARIT